SLEELGLTGIDTSQIEDFIAKVVQERQDFVKEKGPAAVGPLMGIVMGEFRGKVDGKVLSELLKQKINECNNT
ncbi:MAG: GatB/YqeY domain-containing protein, partial [Methanosarcinales archaeon]|nr:GatB/YqeY domain-containing protein [Methanosarcinales archaeon]